MLSCVKSIFVVFLAVASGFLMYLSVSFFLYFMISSCLSFLVPSLITFLLIFLSYLLLAGFLDFFGLCTLSEKARNSARFVLPLSILPIKLGKSFWIGSLSRPETFVGGCSFAETVAGLC